MKVLILNGSPKVNGNDATLLNEMIRVFTELGVETELVQVGKENIRGCIACGYCAKKQGCVFNDLVNETAKKLDASDGLVIASPTYFASPNGTLISFLDRLFHSRYYDLRYKVGAAFAIARRAGTSTNFDVLNKYFTISGMPVVSGDYWNNGFGGGEGAVKEDAEGMRNARVVARRMVFLMEAIALEKKANPSLLEEEAKVWTNFIEK